MRQETKSNRDKKKKEEEREENGSVQIASLKLMIALGRRSKIYVYLNPDNNFFLCPASFLLPCAPSMSSKSAHIYKDFFFFFPILFYIADYFFSLSLSLSLSPFRYSSSTKANNRKNEKERERNRETASLPTHHITLRTYKNLILRSLSFSNAGMA